jgi:molybdopterin-dependent oxidoreductase alpha subunit
VVVVNTTPEKGLERYWVPSDPRSALFGTRLQDDFIRINAGGDIGFLLGVFKAALARGAADRAFIDAHTTGFDDFVQSVAAVDWPALEAASGAARRDMEWVGELLSRARSAVTVYSMGLTQHRFGVQNVEAVVNLHLLRGFIGREKCGIMPIRGHSGVQGGGECGVSPSTLPGNRALTPETAAEMSALWGGFPVPDWKGLTTGPMLEAAMDGRFDLLYNMGGNLLATMPDPQHVVSAFRKVKVRVHQDIVVNTSSLLDPGELLLLLPAQTRYEQRGGGTSTSTERRIRFSPEIPGHPQVGECRPEYEIPCQFAMALRPDLAPALTYRDAQDIRDEMDRTMPVYRGIGALRKAGDSVQWGGPLLCAGGRFDGMPGGRARFTPLHLPEIGVPDGAFYLTTRRGKQFNSIIIKDIDHLMGGAGRRDLYMNPADLARAGVRDGQEVVVESENGRWLAIARATGIQPGVVQAYWPECNPLISRRFDPRSEEPDYNAVVRIRPA